MFRTAAHVARQQARASSGGKNQVRRLSSDELHKPASPLGFVGSTMGSSGLRTAQLILEDGSRFTGVSFGHEESVAGEIVFNTGMVGYPESLTDPSYKGQMLVSTYPLVGNYGVPASGVLDEFGLQKNFESDRIHASAFIVSDYSHHWANWESEQSLSHWLRSEGIPGLYGIDTRLLTKKIRDRGSMLAKIEFLPSYCPAGYEEMPFVDVNARNLIAEVSCKDTIVYGQGNPIKLLSVDCGIKNNIIRNLVSRGVELHRVPFDYDIAANADKFDGLFLSNGPGDPAMASATVEGLKKVFASGFDKPIFGICMGNQLTALAAGASTYKMPFGNRGQNQPVLNLLTGQCYITPQNHGTLILKLEVVLVSVVRCVQVVRGGFRLASHRVHLLDVRGDAHALARVAHGDLVRANALRDLLVAKARLFGLQQQGAVDIFEFSAVAQQVVQAVEAVELGEEPGVDLGVLVDFLHAPAKRAHSVGNSVWAAIRRTLQLFDEFCHVRGRLVDDVVRLVAIHRVVCHAHSLLEGLLKVAPDSHHLADRLHGTPNFARGAIELGQVPARYLGDDVVQGRLEAGRGGLRDLIHDVRQLNAQC